MTNAPQIQTIVPKPAGVPSGTTKTTTRDFTGHVPCIACGRTTTRAACMEGDGHGGRRFVGHVDATGECCVGMLVVTATWQATGFVPVMFDNGDGTATAEWAVCPTCVIETEVAA